MKEEILEQLDDAAALEKLYRCNKPVFERHFLELYPVVRGRAAADFWQQRLVHDSRELSWGGRPELLFVIVAALLGGLLAKLPVLLNLSEEFFYPRNIGFIVLPLLAAFFAWKNSLALPRIAFAGAAMLSAAVFINVLPQSPNSDTLILSCIHLVLFLWFLLGYVFVGGADRADDQRLRFLKYNGDLIVMTTLILIAGGIMSGITIGLFSLIGYRIEQEYFAWVGVFGLAAAPMVGSYLTQTNPHLVGKVSPVIARIFSPLVLIMLVIYLVAMIFSGKNPYNDREYLLVFNALLVGVLALIFFSVADSTGTGRSRPELLVLLLLSGVTVLVNGIALSAIMYRIWEMGITPNRLAVLGGNILILINLLLVTVRFFRVCKGQEDVVAVGQVIARFLPVYFFWVSIVTFLFPLLFRFR